MDPVIFKGDMFSVLRAVNLRHFRKKEGLSKKKASKKSGIPVKCLEEIEDGSIRHQTHSRLISLCNIYGVKFVDLYSLKKGVMVSKTKRYKRVAKELQKILSNKKEN